jgi:trk/ktr system potassium uptake protein
VVVVERNRLLLADLSDRLDVKTLVGNGATVPVLLEAGIEDCELLFATTDSDEANMVVALVGSALFHVPRVVARLRDSGHQESFRALAAEGGGQRLAINPEQAAVERILSLLPVPGAVEVVPFLDGCLLVAGFNIPAKSDFDGLLLSHLRLLFPATPMLVVAIRRKGRWIVPHGEDEIRADDLVYFALDPQHVDGVLALLGRSRPAGRNVMVAGATRIGVELAETLEGRGVPVTLVDERRAACEEAAARLDKTLVIHGLPTDRDLLEEEGIAAVYGFVACT